MSFYIHGCNSVDAAPSTFKYQLSATCAKRHLADFKSGFFQNRLYFVIGTLESAMHTVSSVVHVAMAILFVPVKAVINTLSLLLPERNPFMRNATLCQRISKILNPKEWVVTRNVAWAITHLTSTLNSGIGVLAPVIAYGIDRVVLSPLHRSIGTNDVGRLYC